MGDAVIITVAVHGKEQIPPGIGFVVADDHPLLGAEGGDQGAGDPRGLPLWLPPGQTHAVPKPWAARAMLLNETTNSHCKPLLRHCLVCQPLAQVLLSICFQLEAVERAYLESMNPGLKTSDQSRCSFDDFVRGNKGSPKRFYPSEHPAKPDGPLQFESFGGLLHYFRQSGAKLPERLSMMNEIRNSLAHGHYPNWTMLNEVRNILCAIQTIR